MVRQKTCFFIFLPIALCSVAFLAESTHAMSAQARATLFFAPRRATILEGSMFEVPVFINTHGKSMNTLELEIRFDRAKLQIIHPSGSKSIMGVWLEPPAYSNTEGTVRLVGIIPNGITTESGLVTTLTFKATAPGEAHVVISPRSRILANDGAGSEVATEFDTGNYTILPKPPEGLRVFSETHPFQEQWYNNNSPVFGWEKPPGITDVSFVLDDKPFTIPDTIPETGSTTIGYQNLNDGLSYFHMKAARHGVWGAATHFMIRIDTAPPAAFQPKLEMLTAAIISKIIISFSTTDALSGLDHYEVGVLEKANASSTPLFVESVSPYQLTPRVSGDMRVIVRAFDKAGNVRDEAVDVRVPFAFFLFLKNNILVLLLGAVLLVHYFFRHRIIDHLKRIIRAVRREERSIAESENRGGSDTFSGDRF